MRLEHNGIVIRNAVKGDCERLAAWWNDGRVMAHAGFPLGLGTTAEKVAQNIESDDDAVYRRLMIEFRGEVIGEMSFRNLGGAAEAGIKICEAEYQNRGIGRAALSMLIKELFALGYEKIVLDTNLNNKRAQHVYELLGFRKVAVNIDSWTDQLGKKQSSVDYELTPERFCDLSG